MRIVHESQLMYADLSLGRPAPPRATRYVRVASRLQRVSLPMKVRRRSGQHRQGACNAPQNLSRLLLGSHGGDAQG
jgi:hypothetical protein